MCAGARVRIRGFLFGIFEGGLRRVRGGGFRFGRGRSFCVRARLRLFVGYFLGSRCFILHFGWSATACSSPCISITKFP